MDKLTDKEKKWFRKVKLISEEAKEILVVAALIIIPVSVAVSIAYLAR